MRRCRPRLSPSRCATAAVYRRKHAIASSSSRVRTGIGRDPMLTHLMQHLRASRTARAVGNLAVLTTHDAPFVQRLIDGASSRAERLGYVLDRSVDLQTFAHKPAALTRMLLAPPAKDP